MPAGRPTDYTPELATRICAEIALGYSLRTISNEESMPCVATVFNWLRIHPEFLEQYTRAKEEQADALAEDMLDIADDGTNDWMERTDKEGQPIGWQINGEHVQRSRLRIETRKWIALLIAGTAAAGATVLIKWLGVRDPTKPTTVKVFGVDIPVGKAWIIFMIFTVGHVYVSYVFRMDCLQVLKQSSVIRADAWQSLTGAPLLFFHGLIARLKYVVVNGRPVFIMDNSDPTTWLVHGVVILVFVSIVRYRKSSWWTRIGTTFAALIVVVCNWLIGGFSVLLVPNSAESYRL